MEIPSSNVYAVLRDAGVACIHHANSVITACQFLRSGSLLSRGMVERRGLYQTAQSSDHIDKRYGIWFDVFMDSVDIHERANRDNLYGPVLFVLDLELIRKSYTGKVWVTKLNPTKWAGRSHKEKWFTSKKDLETNFSYGQFDQMIVFRHSGGELPFGKYLKKIILHDPGIKSKYKIDYYSMAYGALRLAMTDGEITAKLRKRKCNQGCACKKNYKRDLDRTKELFIPKI